MEKIRRIAFCIMIASVVCITAACGRNNRNNMAGTSGAGGTLSGPGAGTPTQTGTQGYDESREMNSTGNPSSPSGTNRETGGVLRDMVDDVENGVNNITNDVLGTTGAGMNENGTAGNGTNRTTDGKNGSTAAR